MLEPNREIWQFFKKNKVQNLATRKQRKTSVLAILKGKKTLVQVGRCFMIPDHNHRFFGFW
jgi:hypothetical protein